MNPEGEKKAVLVIVAAVLILAIGALIYFYFVPKKPVAPTRPIGGAPAGAAEVTGDLGSEVYEKASNPISGKLPETVAPVPNPIEGIYKNPFE